MSKIVKRISKSLKIEGNSLVIGDAFGFLSEIINLFPSVFVVMNQKDKIKAKNGVYRDSVDDLHRLPEINFVFLDLNYKNQLDKFENLMILQKPTFLIEGEEVIGREFTQKFYQLGYRAIDQQGYFHTWKKTK